MIKKVNNVFSRKDVKVTSFFCGINKLQVIEMEKKIRRADVSLEKNIAYIEKRFERCSDVVHQKMMIAKKSYPVYVVYMDSMIDRDIVEGFILKSLMYQLNDVPSENPVKYIRDCGVLSADVKMLTDMEEIITEILSGNTAIFGENSGQVIVIDSKSFPNRGVQAAETEVTVRGPKDSFTESVRSNTILIRRRIRDTRLKSEQIKLGVRTKTDVALMYMDDLVQPDVLEEIKKRLKSFTVDSILDSGSLEQFIEKKWYSPFPQFQSTERPDKAAASIMEGRIAVIVDNSPMVLLLPTVLSCFFQAADDYYNRWGIVFFTRILRYAAALIAMALPGFYIAAATYHPEIFPTSLALSLAASRQGVPFGLAVEVLLMELAFELLREAGIRLPGSMGSALGIVGGLIIGQAAVDANIVSPVVVIVVALTALASFTIPNEAFASAFRLIKFSLILSGAFFGILGFTFGMLAVLIHLSGLESFGVPYLLPYGVSGLNPDEDFKDSITRFPLFTMKKRPVFTRKNARRRMDFKKR